MAVDGSLRITPSITNPMFSVEMVSLACVADLTWEGPTTELTDCVVSERGRVPVRRAHRAAPGDWQRLDPDQPVAPALCIGPRSAVLWTGTVYCPNRYAWLAKPCAVWAAVRRH